MANHDRLAAPDVKDRIRKLEALARRPGTAGEGAAARAAIARIKERHRERPRPATKPRARRPNGQPLRLDEKIICDAPEGVFRPCRCSGNVFIVSPGVGPHAAQLVCAKCRRGGRWLSRAYFGGAA